MPTNIALTECFHQHSEHAKQSGTKINFELNHANTNGRTHIRSTATKKIASAAA